LCGRFSVGIHIQKAKLDADIKRLGDPGAETPFNGAPGDAYNPQEFTPLFGILLTGPIFASAYLTIPVHYGMIYRQLPDIEKAASIKPKISCEIQRAG